MGKLPALALFNAGSFFILGRRILKFHLERVFVPTND